MMRRSGFSLIELLVVIGVILLLMGLLLPAGILIRRQAQVTNTRALVRAISIAVTAYQMTAITVADGSGWKSYPVWDWNRDHLLDGRPEIDDPTITSLTHPDHEVYVSGYLGFMDTVRPEIKPVFVNATGHVIDSWKHELRIDHGKLAFGSSGVGIWSIGPDGIDQLAVSGSDDIRGWEMR